MAKTVLSEKKPLLGFFNLFYNFGETCRAISVAKRYKELGGEVVFFSHGGKHEHMVEEIGCKVIQVNPIYSEEFVDKLWKSSRLETFKNPFSKQNLVEHVEEEIAAYKKTNVKMIVSTNNFPCIISARAAGLPLIFITPKVPTSFIEYPDDAEFFFTRLIPKSLKLKILNWYAPRSKMYVKPFIKIAKKYNIPPPRVASDVTKGDYTLYIDSIELLGLDRSSIPSDEYYVGHTFLDELYAKTLDKSEIFREEKMLERHINKEGKSILFSLGSSGTKELFLKILQCLNKTKYNVIAVYNSILDEKELPNVNSNILLKKYVPFMKNLNKMVDLAIIHGGKATVYTAAYSGKPAIGFPMQFEQHLNLEMLVKHGTAHIGSRKYFKEQKLLKNIRDIFDNYDTYLENAQKLADKLPKPEGDRNAAKIILSILEQEKSIN